MSNADIRGRFVWHELTTTSPEGASAFYGKLVPWETQPTAMPSYSMWTAGAATVAGLAAREDDDPHWLVYIGSDDVDATVATAKDLGATVVTPPTDIPGDIGRFAVLDDPQGARFAVYTPGDAAPPPADSGSLGEFTWHELATTDAEEATDFYTELFGWDRGPAHDLGGSMGQYQLVELDSKQIGGIHKGRPGTEPRWLSYIRVADADEAADEVRAAGGRVVNGPMEVPGGSWIVMLEDPQGASIAVHEPALAAKAAHTIHKPKEKEEHMPRKPSRAVAAEQPKPPSASEELLDEDEDDEIEDHEHEEDDELVEIDELDDEEEHEPAKPVRRGNAKPRAKAPARKKAPAKRAAPRRAPASARKKAVARAKTRARPVAVKKKSSVAKKKTRAKAPARAVARARAPVRGRAAPARRVVAKKAVRGRRR